MVTLSVCVCVCTNLISVEGNGCYGDGRHKYAEGLQHGNHFAQDGARAIGPELGKNFH